MNATSKKTTTKTTALDKLWNKTVQEEEDIDMEDSQGKEPTNYDNKKTQTTKNPEKYKERFPTTLRFKIPSASVD